MSHDQPRWLPLESNPEVMSDFLYKMGLKQDWGVVDVIGFDAELLQFLPQPVAALILLYPVSKVQSSGDGIEPVPQGLYFMKQTIGNACGTIALLHSVANCLDQLSLAPDSSLSSFFAKTADMSPEERGRELEGSTQIAETHASSAEAGQTAAPDLAADIDYHFVAFVHKNGTLYELDGRKQGPIEHGSTTAATFLQDAAACCMKTMTSNPDCLNFTAVALCKLG